MIAEAIEQAFAAEDYGNEVELYLHNAEAAADARTRSGDRLEANAILTEAGSLRAIVESVIGDGERACELAQAAVDRAPLGDAYLRGISWFALGTTCHYTGKGTQAIAAYREALPLCRVVGNTTACMLIAGNLAMLHIVEGHLHAAADTCRQAIEETGRSPSPSLSLSARSSAWGGVYSNYSGVLYEWGELDAARRLAERGLELSERGGHAAALAHSRAIVSRVRLALGDIAGARSPALTPSS